MAEAVCGASVAGVALDEHGHSVAWPLPGEGPVCSVFPVCSACNEWHGRRG